MKMKSFSQRSNAFTLVELLVVIAILSILASLLAPSLKKARDSAKSIKCISNIRQIGTAWMLYAADNDDRFPPDCEWQAGMVGGYWMEYLANGKYLPKEPEGWGIPRATPGILPRSILACPSQDLRKESAAWGDANALTWWLTSYGIHGALAGSPSYGVHGRNVAEVPYPATTMLLIDRRNYPSALFLFAYTNDTVNDYEKWVPYERHNGGVNVYYVDGHAGWLKRPIPPPNQGHHFWGALFGGVWD